MTTPVFRAWPAGASAATGSREWAPMLALLVGNQETGDADLLAQLRLFVDDLLAAYEAATDDIVELTNRVEALEAAVLGHGITIP
jgi:hypothetical protein